MEPTFIRESISYTEKKVAVTIYVQANSNFSPKYPLNYIILLLYTLELLIKVKNVVVLISISTTWNTL